MLGMPNGPRALTGVPSRRLVRLAAAVVAVLVLSLSVRSGAVRAQLAYTFATTTTVPSTGTLAINVTTPGVTITGSTPIPDCPLTGIGTATITYTCTQNLADLRTAAVLGTGGSQGIMAGTAITQTFSVPTGPITETVTYNANGPLAGFASVPAPAEETGNCTAPLAGVSLCSVTIHTAIVPFGVLSINVKGDTTGTDQVLIALAPQTLGSCSLGPSSTVPTSPSPAPWVDYLCTQGESIPVGTVVSITVQKTTGTAMPVITASENYDAPLPESPSVPNPTMQTITIPATGGVVGGGAPTLTAITPSTGPAGAAVTITGTNLAGTTMVTFAGTAATGFTCAATGTSCSVTTPAMNAAAGTVVPVTVTAPSGMSNALNFTISPTSGAAVGGSPTLVSIAPANGPAGTVVSVTGTNLQGATGVSFGTAPGSNLLCTATGTSCTVTVPALPAGTVVNVSVSTAVGVSTPLPFTVTGSGALPASTVGGALAPSSSSGALAPSSSAGSAGAAAMQGMTVTYPSGWSVVAGPSGTVLTGSANPLYTYQAGDTNYESITTGTPLTPGQGYWAYFASSASSPLALAGPQTQTIPLPAGQWVMIGNPGDGSASVSGADVVYGYSGAGYQLTTSLAPGQGAWAISFGGGSVTITSP